MKLLFAFILSIASLAAQCSSLLVPQSISFTLQSYGPRGAAQAVSLVPGPGNPYSTTAFGAVAINRDQAGGTSGTGNATMYVYLFGSADQRAPGGPFSDSITFSINGTSCTLSISYTVVARANPRYTNNLGIADSALASSSSSGGAIQGNDLIANSVVGSLPGGTYKLPAQGSTIILPEWNTKIKTCSPVGYQTFYSSQPSMNSDDTAIIMDSATGAMQIISFPDCVAHSVTWTTTPSGPPMWDPYHNNVVYYFDGANHIIRDVLNLTNYTVSSTSTPYTFAGSTFIGNGATDAITDAGYIVFTSNTDHAGSASHPTICAVDILSASPTEKCRDISLEAPEFVGNCCNFAMGSRGFDSRNGKMYVYTNPQNPTGNSRYGPVYSLTANATSLSFEYYFGISPDVSGVPFPAAFNHTDMGCDHALATTNVCLDALQHSHTVQDSAGHQYYVATGGIIEPSPSTEGARIIDFAANSANLTLSKGQGGGFDLALQSKTLVDDIGCVKGWCALAVNTNTTPSCLVTGAATSGSNINLTVSCSQGVPVVTSDPAYVNGVGGCTNANGAWSSVTVSGTTVTLPNVTCNATYTAATGTLIKNSYAATQGYHGEVILAQIENGSAIRIHRLGVNFRQLYSDSRTVEDYWEQGQCNLSFDLKWVMCNSNGGIPDNRFVTVMNTGINDGTPSLVTDNIWMREVPTWAN